MSPALLYNTNIAMVALAQIFAVLRPLIFVFLFVIVMSILGLPFAELKSGAR